MEGISLKKHPYQNQTGDDAEVLQSTETTSKVPIHSNLEMLAENTFIKNIQDGEENKNNKSFCFICWHITLQSYTLLLNCFKIKKDCRIVFIIRKKVQGV